MATLSSQQKLFIAEYLKDRNGKQAAIRAGYAERSAEVQASRLLSKDKVRAAVDSALAKVTKTVTDKLEITAEKVLRDLEEARIAAMADGQISAAIRASELQGKSLPGGLFSDNVNNKVEDITPRTPLDRARRIAFLLARAQREAKQAQAIPATPEAIKH